MGSLSDGIEVLDTMVVLSRQGSLLSVTPFPVSLCSVPSLSVDLTARKHAERHWQAPALMLVIEVLCSLMHSIDSDSF